MPNAESVDVGDGPGKKNDDISPAPTLNDVTPMATPTSKVPLGSDEPCPVDSSVGPIEQMIQPNGNGIDPLEYTYRHMAAIWSILQCYLLNL